jgi:5-methylcytosine-specific restriction endonuclease McrA
MAAPEPALGDALSAPLRDDRGAIGFAEQVLELLEEGRYTATYKYAVLLALLDLSLEHTKRTGAPPEMFTTYEVARKIVEIYWRQVSPFLAGKRATVLVQNTRGQAEIVRLIERFRAAHAPDPSTPFWEARAAQATRFEKLEREVEWKLIEMPLPRLQVLGDAAHEFIYTIGWTTAVRRSDVALAQRDGSGTFDNRILLRPDVGRYLQQLNGLLRPLLHRRWSAMVARLNDHDEARLEDFLFGAERVVTRQVRRDLWLVQGRRCFYCGHPLDVGASEVDHFIPWARYPDDGLDNLVVADRRCNGDKRAFLAAVSHLARWAPRAEPETPESQRLQEIAQRHGWARNSDRTFGVARAIYLGLPVDARLWLRAREFVSVDRPELVRALGAA